MVWSSSTRSSAPDAGTAWTPAPTDVIFFNEDLNIAQKCTGCAHLLDDGWNEPRCADACPTLAIRLMDEDEAEELVAKGEVWKPELKDELAAPGLLPEPAQEVHRRHSFMTR